jgi:hypothetical protein
MMNMRNFWFGWFLTLAGLTSVHATPSTHIWGPSTDVQAFKTFHITADYYLPTEQTTTGARIPPVTNTGLTVGILPFKKLNAEVGIDHKSGLVTADDYPLYFNGKLAVPENAFGSFFPAVAVGIYDVGTKSDVTNNDVAYGKIAKTFAVGRFSVGYFTGNKKLLLDDKGEKDNSGLMAVWERTMNEISPNLWLCAEYMGTKSGYGTMNIGGTWKFANNVGVLAGYDLYNNSDIPSTFTVQVDIDFSLVTH